MKIPAIPYKIIRTLPAEGTTLITGSVLGIETAGPLILLPVAITLLLMSGFKYSIVFAAVCAVLLFILPFICRFRIEVSPQSLVIQIKYLGIAKERIAVPFDKVLIKHHGFRDINEACYDDYCKHEKDYLALEYDSGWDDPIDYVRIYFKGKEILFSAEQGKFETELWKHLTEAIRTAYDLREM